MSRHVSRHSLLQVSLSLALASCVTLAVNAPAQSRPAKPAKPQATHNQKSKQPAFAQRAQVHAQRAPVRERAFVVRPAEKPASMFSSTMSTSVLISEARKYMGTNPTARTKLWCATFMNMVLARTGYAGTGSDAAKSFASYGKRVSEPRIGAIAVLTRGKRGGHVGIVTGIDANGKIMVLSGNHNRRVAEAPYPASRIYAYVMPK